VVTGDEALQVLSTLGVFSPLRDLIGPAYEAQTGVRLSITFDPTTVLLAAIASGRRADVVVAIEDGAASLVEDGVLASGSMVRVASTGVGLAKRVGLPPVDISTPELFREALLAAKSIVFSQSGASGIFFAGLIERLGIADDIRAKALIVPKGFTAERLVLGEADFAVQQISELLAVPGVEIVGPFPQPYQVVTTFAAAVFAGSVRVEQAHLFIKALTGPEAAAAFAAAGLEPCADAGPVAAGHR